MFQRREQASRLHSTGDEKDRLRREALHLRSADVIVGCLWIWPLLPVKHSGGNEYYWSLCVCSRRMQLQVICFLFFLNFMKMYDFSIWKKVNDPMICDSGVCVRRGYSIQQKHKTFKEKKKTTKLNTHPLLAKQLYFSSGNYSGTTSTISTVIISSLDDVCKFQTRCIIMPSTGQQSDDSVVHEHVWSPVNCTLWNLLT